MILEAVGVNSYGQHFYFEQRDATDPQISLNQLKINHEASCYHGPVELSRIDSVHSIGCAGAANARGSEPLRHPQTRVGMGNRDKFTKRTKQILLQTNKPACFTLSTDILCEVQLLIPLPPV